jgi:hypothetical protein
MFDRFRFRLCAAIAALGLQASVAAAQTTPVVELFTSQGCSSCPPADELLGELVASGEVIALSLHVDYWDYLGWRDVFASPDNTRRQVAYRDAVKARSVYTPQIIVNGVDRMVGSNRNEVLASIRRHAKTPLEARIDLTVVDGMLKAEIEPVRPASNPCTVWVVAYHSPHPVEIENGENSGRTITYSNVTTDFMRLGVWKGGAQTRVMAPIPPGSSGMAVILQEGDYGRIIAAASIEF